MNAKSLAPWVRRVSLVTLVSVVLVLAACGGSGSGSTPAPAPPPPAPVAAMQLFAGSIVGQGSVDGSGAAALFHAPSSVAADAAGNLYVTDSANNTIRKIGPTGVTTTLAGTAGYAGSADGTGAAARFNGPTGIAVDSTGTVYVTDTGNSTIRKISPAGVVTTLAGNPVAAAGRCSSVDGAGAAAAFCSPTGIVVASTGDVFVADTYGSTIRRVTPLGIVTTLAGSPHEIGLGDGLGAAAVFDVPTGLAIDGADNLYTVDDDTLRMITPAGLVTTLAGLNVSAGSADGTGSAARFFSPQGLAAARDGTLYVADTAANAIRKVSTAAVVTTVAGTLNSPGGSADGVAGAASFNQPYGVAVGPDGSLYVADLGNNAVRRVTPDGAVTTLAGTPPVAGSVDATAGAARFAGPAGLATDAAGNVYVADQINDTIRKITPGGVVTTIAGDAGLGGAVDGTGRAARFRQPGGVAADGSGNVYVADTFNSLIRKISSAGAVQTIAGTTAHFFPGGPSGLVDGTGPGASFQYPGGLATDVAGSVYVADSGNNAIRKVTPQGVVTTVTTGGMTRLSKPQGVAVDPAGNLYVADTGNHTLRMITPTGVVTTLAGQSGTPGSADGVGGSARFNFPVAVALSSSGDLYVADWGNATIRKVTSSGAVTTVVGIPNQAGFVAGPLPGMIPAPVAIALSGTTLYIGAVNGVLAVSNVP